MKKIVFFLGGMVAAFAMTAAASTLLFTDSPQFESWYAPAVSNMSQKGVLEGYPDGSFKPGNTVNRAELAVILDRFYDSMKDEFKDSSTTPVTSGLHVDDIETLLRNYDHLKDSTLPSFVKVAITLAESGYRKMDPPSAAEMTELSVNKEFNLPEGYTLYEDQSVKIVSRYYLHFVGERIEGDIIREEDQWYGPF